MELQEQNTKLADEILRLEKSKQDEGPKVDKMAEMLKNQGF